MRLQTTIGSAAAAICAATLTGCTTSGLSPREQGSQSYSMTMYEAAGPAAHAAPAAPAQADGARPSTAPVIVAVSSAPIRMPARVGVAQLGEVAPPDVVMTALRKRTDLFRRVLPVTGSFTDGTRRSAGPTYNADQNSTYNLDDPTTPARADQLVRMRAIAGSLGLDYLLVFGGSIDHGNQGSGLQLLDLTILGAFVIPSHGVVVDGKAAGSLIDVRTGQILRNFSAQAKSSTGAASAFVGNVEQGRVLETRDELIAKLAADVVLQMEDERESAADR